VLKMHGFLPQEKVADFSFALRKTLKNDDLSEDITAYLDARLCLARTNKQVLGPDGECQSYMFRKVKIGTWAKTSLRGGPLQAPVHGDDVAGPCVCGGEPLL